MEIREFAEKILFSRSLEDKLAAPSSLTDLSPGSALSAPAEPDRPSELRFRQEKARFRLPALENLDKDAERGRLLHFFANHELLATELMALVLLKFPDAPKAFRSGVLQTLKEEQIHTKLYLSRLQKLGVSFGEYPVTGFFWRMISDVSTPMDYVSRLSLTFEQANLDYSKFYADQFRTIGDGLSQKLMERIYEDEIGHVSYGLKWFRKWKSPDLSDWEAFESQLQLPQSANRAKAEPFNREGRRRAGLTDDFVDRLFVYSKSKGRTPGVFVFNPFAESVMGRGTGFEPNKRQAALAVDLENMPQFLCRQDDVVLVRRKPRTEFLAQLKEAGFELPQFETLTDGRISTELSERKIRALQPWAWSPDTIDLLQPLVGNLAGDPPPMGANWSDRIRPWYSKARSAELLRELVADPDSPDWMCGAEQVGECAATYDEAIDLIRGIRRRGHHRVVAKMLFGVAGSNMQRLWEPELTESQRKWLRRTIETEGGVVIEPWLDRVFDFSFQFDLTSEGLRQIGFVEMLNDRRGQYQASVFKPMISNGLDPDLAAFLNGPRSGRLKGVFDRLEKVLAPKLAAAGFRGALGVDAFVYRDGEALRLKPVTEINARYTMGRLVIELMRNAVSGRTGRLELISPPMLKQRGHSSFPGYADELKERHPIRLAGRPKPRISEGAICLNDPTTATGCLVVLWIGLKP